ncbi:CPBP family intramembrane glutamic endopeptidase [Coprobacter tertius]|uniref:CPBP family intramembrane metalloprotease n=1 Tax=Coprobacter tertius TaxID=2944915 RepID=A0ABT1MEE3_9BACT|nr:type II CAAX endopeptidase family protein [Coprobacter tertius]MCP9610997.1 CPBP family intramembrane metalloprotease [Coprobacter tertius]
MDLINKYAKSSFTVKLFAALAVFLLMMLFTLAVLGVVSYICSGKFAPENLVRILTAIQTMCLFVLPPFFIAFLYSYSPIHYLHLDKLPSFRALVGVFLCMIASIPFLNWTVAWNESMQFPEFMSGIETWMKNSEETARQVTEQLISVQTLGGLLAVIIIVGVLAGIGEELTFRGIFQRLFLDKFRNKHLAIWTAAIVFSTIHLQFYGFIPRMLLGAFFGYLLVWSGNIWLPIFAHFLNNSVAVVYNYLSKEYHFSNDFETIGTSASSTGWMAWCSLFLFVVLCIVFYRIAFKQNHVQDTGNNAE